MCFNDGGDGGASDYREAEEERQRKTIEQQNAINSVFDTYDEDFTNQQAQNYLDYANPQINEQFGDAMDGLRFALDRQGITRSSMAAERKAKAQKALAREQVAAANRAETFAGETNKAIEAARREVLTDAGSLADANAAASLATRSAAANARPPTYEPLYDIFRDVTAGLATQADLERRNSARYPGVLFDTGSSARTVKG